ncbi:HNH endonuclease [Amycolatopsis sp. NBC_00438]|uniref:HNH endonuclease n=1 Tax=Amycolatopsis sp. NBC_00438 TaxID=2903558 RepID=UPI002E22E0AF
MEGYQGSYPLAAYVPDGTLWWQLKLAPGAKRPFGDEQKLAAWLAFNCVPGDRITMRQLRAALGEEDRPNAAEHLNRRLRVLRQRDGWQIPSARDDGSLGHDEYRLDAKGWHPGLGRSRPKNDAPSDSVRRRVFERDGRTCVVCGIAAGESYDDLPEKRARLTLGHRIPGKRLLRGASVDELQAECARCNETVRDGVENPLTLPEILPDIRGLPRKDKQTLLDWLQAGRRNKSRLDIAYAEVRRLSAKAKSELMKELEKMVG